MQKQKGISTLAGVIIIVVVAAVFVGGVFAYQYFVIKSSQIKIAQPINQTAGWKTYTNSQYGFEINLEKIKEAKEKWNDAVAEIKKLQICDLSFLLLEKLKKGKNILAEGAQAVMLDIDFGDYPNVTSSNTLPAELTLIAFLDKINTAH